MRSDCCAPVWHPKSTSGAGKTSHWGYFDFVFTVWHFWAAGTVCVKSWTVALQVWPCVQNTYKKIYFWSALLPAGFTVITRVISISSPFPAWPSRMTPRICPDYHCPGVRFSLIYLRPEARDSEWGDVGQFWKTSESFFVLKKPTAAIRPQLSKCLKFEAVRGGLNWSNDLNLNKELQQDPCMDCSSQNGAL